MQRALRLRAIGNDRSTEAEIRDILKKAVKPEERVRLGDALAALGRRAHLTDKDLSTFERNRMSPSAAKSRAIGPPGIELKLLV